MNLATYRPLFSILFLALAAAFTSRAAAQTPGDCTLGTAERDLNVSNVRSRLFNTGSLFYGNSTTDGTGYLVPFRRGISPSFAAGLWVGGLVEGELRAAGARYDRFEFWPGPLTETGELPNPADCSAYDRIFVVSAEDVARYDKTGLATADLVEWPVELGAEVIDGDGVEGNYNLEGGDRPRVFGSQTAFWVMNDVGNEHGFTLTEPIGLEVQVTAFAVASVERAFDEATFYRYRLVNRSPQALEQAYAAFFQDPDLGDSSDDYVGTDTTRGLAFTYNATNVDAVYGIPPAFGVDFLDGLGSTAYFLGGGPPGTGEAVDGEEMYNSMRGLWPGGVPYTEMGYGYMTDGPVTRYVFSGDPVTQSFWSEVNLDGTGTDDTSGDRRLIAGSPEFALAPGATKDLWLALLFARGTDRFDSVTALRAASDAVQSAFDDGSLLQTALPPALPVTLATPALLAPADGAAVEAESVLRWEAVPGAAFYRVEIAQAADFAEADVYHSDEPELSLSRFHGFPINEVAAYHWRVRAEEDGPRPFGVSAFSEVRTFTYYEYASDLFGGGVGIVEVAYPGVGDVCAGAPADPGCQAGYGGNTVWRDPNSTQDYLLTTPSVLDAFVQTDIIGGDDFELRFTEACAEPGACLGAYIRGDDEITSVPFELWNLGNEDDGGMNDPSDDVRMIPLVRTNNEPLADWADAFTGEEPVTVDGEEVTLPVTERVFFMMPDRDDGYARFAAAADGFGGPGAVYDRESDGDTQVDLNANGEPCAQQEYYIDFCYRSVVPYRAPVGGAGSAGLLVADLAGDGTTPPVGTVVRFDSNPLLLAVGTEEDGSGAQPVAFAIKAAWPNPFQATTTVAYSLGTAADVHLSVYDVLGRRVAVLAEGAAAAGDHRARIDGSVWASGVYLVVLEAGGERHTRKLLLVR